MATVTWTATLWTDDIEPVDHAALGLARLIWQYRGDQPRLQALLETWLDELQSLEDVTWQVMVERWPLTAEGLQLDTIGRIVGQERAELADDAYRVFLLAKIYANLADGRLDDLLHILVITGAEDIDATEQYPAAIRLEANEVAYPGIVRKVLDLAKAAGVLLAFVYSRNEKTSTFQFSSSPGVDGTSATSGFGSTHAATGGGLAGVLR